MWCELPLDREIVCMLGAGVLWVLVGENSLIDG